MFTLDEIVTRIHDETGFKTEIANEEQPALSSEPIVYVGYLSDEPAHELSSFNGQFAEGLEGFGEINVEAISIQILTTMENIIAHKTAVKNAFAGWSPDPTNSELSSFVSFGGSILNLNNGRVHWGQKFGMTYPTL